MGSESDSLQKKFDHIVFVAAGVARKIFIIPKTPQGAYMNFALNLTRRFTMKHSDNKTNKQTKHSHPTRSQCTHTFNFIKYSSHSIQRIRSSGRPQHTIKPHNRLLRMYNHFRTQLSELQAVVAL